MLEKVKSYMIDIGISDNSLNSYICDLNSFFEYYNSSYGEDPKILYRSEFLEYISYLKRTEVKPTTINRRIVSLKHYNNFLIAEKLQNDFVILKKDSIKIVDDFNFDTLPQDDDINKLKHSAIENKRDYCFLILAIYGGLRESEIVSIRLSFIYLEDRYLCIIGKGNKLRNVVINDFMYEAISLYLEERHKILPDNPYLFVGKKSKFYDNKPLNRNVINRVLKKYEEKAKLTRLKLHPHLLRSWFCTNALDKAEYSLSQVQKQAGHENINTTKKYLKDNSKADILVKANKM